MDNLNKTNIALLRGINVAGHNLIRMADLREMMNEAGFYNVRTYIQSGNIVFESSESHRIVLENRLREAISRRFGLTVPVLIRTAEELCRSVKLSPYDGVSEPVSVYLTFLDEIPKSMDAMPLEAAALKSESWTLIEDVFYLHCPEGYSKTKLSNNFVENSLGVRSTTRNIRTVRKLLDMAVGGKDD